MAGTDGPGGTGAHSSRREPLALLRAKHRDYCSARVFRIIQRMSPDEMFVFVEDLARDSRESGEFSYDEMVRLATTRIYSEEGLPSFEDWVEQYRTNPEHFNAVLLGLWRVRGRRPASGLTGGSVPAKGFGARDSAGDC